MARELRGAPQLAPCSKRETTVVPGSRTGVLHVGTGAEVQLLDRAGGTVDPHVRCAVVAGLIPGTMLYDVLPHARTLWSSLAQYYLSPTDSLYFDLYNLTNDWTNNDCLHAFGREIPSCAAGTGTNFERGGTSRF